MDAFPASPSPSQFDGWSVVIALCLDIGALEVGKHRSSVCYEVADEAVADVIIGCSTPGSVLLDFSGYR